MRFGPQAWVALFLVVIGAIVWTEAVMAAVRGGSETAMKVTALLPLILLFGLVFVWRLLHPVPERPEDEKVAMRLWFRGAPTFFDRGVLRRDGGLLVFEGTKTGFAIGHDALLDRPVNLIGDYGAKLAGAPEGTRLALRGDPKMVREWAKETSEPTRTLVPLLVMPEPEGPPPGYLANFAGFATGCVLMGALLGGYIDWRGFSRPEKPLLGVLPLGIGGLMALLALAVLSTRNQGKPGRAAAREAGFQEAEPWKPPASQSRL